MYFLTASSSPLMLGLTAQCTVGNAHVHKCPVSATGAENTTSIQQRQHCLGECNLWLYLCSGILCVCVFFLQVLNFAVFGCFVIERTRRESLHKKRGKLLHTASGI